jgi:hypothetical protein
MRKIGHPARWLIGMRAKRLIPYYKIGGKVVFDAKEVRDAIEKNCHVYAIRSE